MLDIMKTNGIVDFLGNITIYMNDNLSEDIDNLSEDIIDYFFINGEYAYIDNKDTLWCEIDGFNITFIY